MKLIKTFLLTGIFALGLIPTFSMAITEVNINKADLATLEKVKGLGPKKAKALVEYRKDHGDFKSLEDLTRVKGIGKKTLTRIETRKEVKLTVNSTAP